MPGFARENNVPEVRGQMLRDFVRLTFEWPEPTLFTAKTEGNDVILTFDRKANPNMAAMLRDLSPAPRDPNRHRDQSLHAAPAAGIAASPASPT